MLYDDGHIACGDDAVLIRWYYPWGTKRIPYSAVRGVKVMPLTGANRMRKWRIWGSGDFSHWWNLDAQRPSKDTALVIDVGHRIYPTITPDNPSAVELIISGHMNPLVL